MRRPTQISKCRTLSSSLAEEIDLTRIKNEYRRNKMEYNESPEGLLDKAIRRIVQENSLVEETAKRMIFESVKTLKEEILAMIKTMSEEDLSTFGYVRFGTVDYIVKKLDIALKRLKLMCEKPEYLKYLNPTYYTEYEKLFIDLIDNVDIRFAAYAPQRSLLKKKIKFHELPDVDLVRIAYHVNELGLFENESFKTKYATTFKSAIDNILEK